MIELSKKVVNFNRIYSFTTLTEPLTKLLLLALTLILFSLFSSFNSIGDEASFIFYEEPAREPSHSTLFFKSCTVIGDK